VKRAQPGIKIGYLEQEPPLDPNKDVRGNVEDGVREALMLWRVLIKFC
jgi:ATPase subunit of ABC transporter with duplicated ATPase domains